MNINETYNERFFDKRDKQLINEIKKKDKRRIILFVFVLIACILVIPIIPDRNGDILVEDMGYLNTTLLVAIIFLILFGLPLLIFMIRKHRDYNNEKKIVIETKIKKIRHDKSDLKLSLTSPYFKSKWIFVYRDRIYPEIAINDLIKISYLPKTKFVFTTKCMGNC